jgi:preprotein translocase subunit SecA
LEHRGSAQEEPAGVAAGRLSAPVTGQGTGYDRSMSQDSEVLCQAALARVPWARRLSEAELLTATEDLHHRLLTDEDRGSVLADVFAVGLESVGRGLGDSINETVPALAATLWRGGVVQKGVEVENRDANAAMAVVLYAHAVSAGAGGGVHLVLGSETEAGWAADFLAAVLRPLGVEVGHLSELATAEDRRRAIGAAVVCGSYGAFCLDFLKTEQVGGPDDFSPRARRFAMVSDANEILIGKSDAEVALLLPEEEADERRFQAMAEFAAALLRPEHFFVSPIAGLDRTDVILTAAGKQRLAEKWGVSDESGPKAVVLESDLIEALRVAYCYTEGGDYSVVDGKVVLQEGVGIQADHAFSGGRRQAIEAAKGLAITPLEVPLATIDVPAYLRLYDSLSGLAAGQPGPASVFDEIYGLAVIGGEPRSDLSEREKTRLRVDRWRRAVSGYRQEVDELRAATLATQEFLPVMRSLMETAVRTEVAAADGNIRVLIPAMNRLYPIHLGVADFETGAAAIVPDAMAALDRRIQAVGADMLDKAARIIARRFIDEQWSDYLILQNAIFTACWAADDFTGYRNRTAEQFRRTMEQIRRETTRYLFRVDVASVLAR